ncbi:MAG: hypothetical protein HYX24_02040 [Candidatus Aenigmarchaeota archaeon]|nr:hypothetical protein [Candidatus Aenigmarchaeota archaeon]
MISKCGFVFAMAGMLFLSGCIQSVPEKMEKEAFLGEPFRLKISEAALIKSENLTIEFTNVTEDSRCPSGSACIWAGQVTAVARVSKEGRALGNYSLTRMPGASLPAAIAFDRYSISLTAIDPYPETSRKIEKAEYVATFVVSRE